METAIKKPARSPNAKLVAISAFFGSIGLLCIIFHISPITIFEKLADFAAHHYFITGFIFLIISLICLKLYYSRNDDSPLRLARRRSRAVKRKLFLANLEKRMSLSNPSEESLYIKSGKIAMLKFNTEEVLESKEDQYNRYQALQKAVDFGKLKNQKVIICFKADNSPKHTLAMVWYADEKDVCINDGITIPAKRIYKIEI